MYAFVLVFSSAYANLIVFKFSCMSESKTVTGVIGDCVFKVFVLLIVHLMDKEKC